MGMAGAQGAKNVAWHKLGFIGCNFHFLSMKGQFWLFQLLRIIRKQLPSLRLDMWEARVFSGEDEPRQASEAWISQALPAC